MQGTIVVPCFCSQLFKSGSLAVAEGWGVGVGLSYIIVHNLPQLHTCSYFESLVVSFYFFGSGGEVCLGANTAAKGPRSQLVSCPLKQKWKQKQGHSTLHVQ